MIKYSKLLGLVEDENGYIRERLSELMSDRGITTYSLGKNLGVSDETVRRWKNGQHSILLPQIISLCDYFNCSIEYLIGKTEVFLDYAVQPLPTFFERLRYVMKEKMLRDVKLLKICQFMIVISQIGSKAKTQNLLL